MKKVIRNNLYALKQVWKYKPSFVIIELAMQQISYMFQYVPQFYQHSLYMENVYPILNYEPTIEKEGGKSINQIDSIAFEDVSFSYPFTDRQVLSHV